VIGDPLRQAIVVLMVAGSLAAIESTARLGAQSRYPVVREQQLSRTLAFNGAGDRLLEVSVINGTIHVVGQDGDTVEVNVRKTIRAETEQAAAAAETEAPVTFSDSAGTIRAVGSPGVRPGCDQKSTAQQRERPLYVVAYDFEIRAPRQVKLRLCTVNGGHIRVEGMAGDFSLDNVNGGITLTGVRGSGRAVTVNGDIEASFVDVPQAAVLLRSVNGDLEGSFPRSLSADLRLKTFNGDLYTDFDVTPLPAEASAERRNGMFVYGANRFGMFRVGRGGPELTFDAFNGDVRVLARH
jgi:hypothetical protein